MSNNIQVLRLREEYTKLFDVDIDSRIINFIVNWQLSKKRSGTHSVKNMSTVHGTNRKPHNQKGSGRARQGSKKAPHMRGGAVSMGPVPRSYEYSINKKLKLLGLKMIIADKINNNVFIILDSFINDAEMKTSQVCSMINELNVKRPLFIVTDTHEHFRRSARNIKNVQTLHVNGLNVYSIIKNETLIVDIESGNALIQRIGGAQ